MKQTTRVLLLSATCAVVALSVAAAAETVVKTVPVLQAQEAVGGGQKPTKAQEHYRKGVEFMGTSRFLDAVEQFQLCIDEEGENVDCHRQLAFAYTQMGQTEADYWEDALDVYRDLEALLPADDVDVRRSIAYVQAATGEVDDAIGTYEEILEITPEDCDIWGRIGDAEKGQAERIKQSSEAGAEDPAYLTRIDKAVKAYTEVTTLCPNSLETWENLGAIYFDRGQFEDAAGIYTTMLEKDPDNVDILSKLGYIHRKAEPPDWAEASRVYGRIVELDPSRVSARNSYGVSLQRLRKHTEAVAQYQTIIDLDPVQYGGLYCQICNLYALDAKDGEKAIQIAMKGIAANAPNQGCLTYFWGKGLELRGMGMVLEGRYDRAITTYREAKLKFSSILTDPDFGAHAKKELGRMDNRITIAEQTREKARQSGR
jgi:tetratricopeptide (TPR) repeat protein